jgi:flagellar assembly factor FliW
MATSTAANLNEEEYMEINTRYGKQVVAKSSLLSFPHGLPGFDELREFTLFHEEGKSTVYYLQSTQDPDIRLPVVTPESCKIDYRIELTDEDVAELQAESDDDIVVVVTVSDNREDGGNDITANFMAPIIINTSSRIGIQKPLNEVSGGVVIQAS